MTASLLFVAPATLVLAFSGCRGSSSNGGGAVDATAPPPRGDDAAPGVGPEASITGRVPVGNCSPADSRHCDVVLNDCPSSEAGAPGECRPGQVPDAAFCTFASASQHLPPGHSCCPSTAEEPCLSGSICIGDPCVDGGPAVGRCSARCCDDSVCGQSPEGIAGHCGLIIVDDAGDSLYTVCSYLRPCKPFHLQPCPADEVCLIEDRLGTSQCIVTYELAGGDGSEGQICVASNSCAEGLSCLQLSDDPDSSTSTCAYNCLVAGQGPPLDASADAAPGYGGCPQGEVCVSYMDPNVSPPWLGYCSSP